MDYMGEISSFYDWLETNTLTDSAIVLWHALMHTCNRAGWPDEFAVAISTLSNKTGLKKDAINRARHRLQQVGRIEFQSRSGQQSAIYKIIPFLTSSVGLNDTNRVINRSQYASQTAPQGASIIKDFNASSASSSATGEYESYYAAHKRVFGFDCNPYQSGQLAAYIDQDGMDERVVIRAIERAGRAAAGYNFNLITRILDDYFHSGAITLDQAIELDKQFDTRKRNLRATSPTARRKLGKVHSFAELAKGAKE